MLFWALLASGQITMRKVDGWQTLADKLEPQCIDLTWGGSLSTTISTDHNDFSWSRIRGLEPSHIMRQTMTASPHIRSGALCPRTMIPHARGIGLGKGGILLARRQSCSQGQCRSPPARIQRIVPEPIRGFDQRL
jgi:hypothetical protein